MIRHTLNVLLRGGPAVLTALLILSAGCAISFPQRTDDDGATRVFTAERQQLMAAIRDEVEDRDYRVRYADARSGRLTALSWVRSEVSFRNSRQIELEFHLTDLGPGETEVLLVVNEIEERDLVRDRPMVSRRVSRDRALYRVILDGVAERLKSADGSTGNG
jgi:hypothetical protein